MIKTLLLQYVTTKKDLNGNPRELILATRLTIDDEDGFSKNKTVAIDIGYRTPLSAVEESLPNTSIKESIGNFDFLNWLESIEVSPKEYKRLLKQVR